VPATGIGSGAEPALLVASRRRLPPLQERFERWCLVRRSLSDPDDLQASVTVAPAGTDLATLVQVAGRRWTIAVAFEHAKGAGGLDQYEVRRWTGW